MAHYEITVNGHRHDIDVDPEMPLLWVLRDVLGLKGTKFGCGVAECGSCTVLMDGEALRSCALVAADAVGAEITTIEGLSADGGHPVQRAWVEDDVPQCGYCQPGQILQAVALLDENPKPSDDDIDTAMSGVLCRCGTYQRIRRAIHKVAEGRS